MSSTTSTPYDWLSQIPRSLLELDNVPLYGFIPPFPWERFGETLSSTFETTGLTAKSMDTQWREAEKLYDGLADDLIPLNIAISGVEGSLCWVLSKQDILRLSSFFLKIDSKELVGLDPDLEDSFYRFIAHQVIRAIEATGWDPTLSLRLLAKTELPHEDSLCSDIQLKYDNAATLGRLIISPALQKNIKKRFSDRSMERPEFKAPLAEKIDVTLHLEIGRTSIPQEQWKTAKQGDLLLLDTCSMRNYGDGNVTLTLKGTPVLTAHLKDNALKLIEHPLQQEVPEPMDNDPDDDEFEEFEDDFEEFEDFDEDETFGEEEPLPENAEEEELPEDEGEIADETVEAAESEETPEPEEEAHIEASVAPYAAAPISPAEIPMHVVVEVGRLKMSIQKLMDLKPGNVLDLNLSPEDGVDLTINGKKVAKGELLKVGDVLGVRILDIG